MHTQSFMSTCAYITIGKMIRPDKRGNEMDEEQAYTAAMTAYKNHPFTVAIDIARRASYHEFVAISGDAHACPEWAALQTALVDATSRREEAAARRRAAIPCPETIHGGRWAPDASGDDYDDKGGYGGLTGFHD